MKIAFVIPSMLRGGAERAMSILCNEFYKKGNTVSLCLTEIVDDIQYPLDSGIKIVDFRCKRKIYATRIPTYINKIKNYIETEKIDIVVSFITRTNIYAIIACKLAKVPVVVSERNNPYIVPANPHFRRLRDFVYKYSSGVVFQTYYARNYYGDKISSNSVIIMNPVTMTEEVMSYCDRKDVITTACRLAPQKNLPLLINAFAKICDKIPNYDLHIYGDGPQYETLQKLIKEKNLETRIYLKGLEKNVIEKVSESKIFVLSSDFEGLSNSLAEAVCAGAACIATDSPTYGNRDLIIDNENGYLTPVGDVNLLADKILKLALDNTIGAKFSQKSLEMRKVLQTSEIIEQWDNYLKRIMNKKNNKHGGGKAFTNPLKKIKSILLCKLGLGCESAEMLRARGVTVGERLQNYGVIDNGHGYLISIGDDVTISAARILAHDGSTQIWTGYSKIGRVTIGNRVFIGAGVIIMPNVTIGDDVIIGAGSIVNKDIPSDSIAVGNPVRVIGRVSDYIKKNKIQMTPNIVWNTYWKNKSNEEINEIKTKLRNGGFGYDV